MKFRLSRLVLSVGLAALLAPVGARVQHLTPLELFLTETLAWEQFAGLVKTENGISNGKNSVLFRSSKALAKEFLKNPEQAEESFKSAHAVIYTEKGNFEKIDNRVIFRIKHKPIVTTLSMGSSADISNFKNHVIPGHRYTFFCKFESYKAQSLQFDNCLPIDQYLKITREKMLRRIDGFLNGKSEKSLESAHYAMLAYMAMVTARMLSEDSFCRSVAEEGSWTFEDIRRCGKDVEMIWSNPDNPEHFYEVMDDVLDRIKKKGADVSLLDQAGLALD